MKKRFTLSSLVVVLIVPGLSAPVFGQVVTKTQKSQSAAGKAVVRANAPKPQEPVMVVPGDIKWSPVDPMHSGLPAGAQIAVLEGDPDGHGFFAIRLKAPDGYKVHPHWHPTDEHVTVIQGSLVMGTGKTVDESSVHEMTQGSYATMPKEIRHYAWTKGDTEIQVTGMGPFKIIYVNATDDPRHKG